MPAALPLDRPTSAPSTPALATDAVVRPILRPKKKTTGGTLTAKPPQVAERPPIVTESLPRDSRILARLVSPIDPKRPGPVRAVVDEDVLQENGRVLVPSGSIMACRSISSQIEPTIEGYAANARVKVRCESITVGNRRWLFGGYAIGQDKRDGPHGLLAVGGYRVPEKTPFTVYVEHER